MNHANPCGVSGCVTCDRRTNPKVQAVLDAAADLSLVLTTVARNNQAARKNAEDKLVQAVTRLHTGQMRSGS